MALTATQRKQEQRRRDKNLGFKRVECRLVDNAQAETELNLAVAKINVKYAK